ncbi:efflux RND transporter periplasmic adaptor subunit [Antarcticibacterium arcticum]|uniref:Efflux RND transporter periplasmic adaptor subunit n=2 Tax=Antarcticibacterium arcticum TaxID=2585771 RepID=A0A5B8YLX1_9FLAO|nr:efflux RND transporter periplasmic adaptor subunit [Antarcticibacterium arcticum]
MKNKRSQYYTIMKKFVFGVATLLLISCGNSENKSVKEVIDTNDLAQIKSKKLELSERQREINTQIDMLDAAIIKLDPERNIPLVTTKMVVDTSFRHFTEVQGDVATKENILIYPEFSGLLREVYVKEGQKVNKGAILARIDDGGLSSQLAQIEAQAALAKTTFERQKRLWEQNIGSEIQYLEAKTNYDAAQNSVNQIRTQVGKTVVRAPFTGVIDQVISDQGVVVNPGQNALFRLVNLDNMYVQAAVPESYLGKIKTGTAVVVEIAAIGQEFEGVVRQVGNFINPDNRSFQIEVALPNKDGQIKPNLIATVKLNDYTSENAIIVPENTIQQNSQGQTLVYIFEKESDSTGVAKRVIVETGYTYREDIEILSGLEPGDLIIIEGGRNLRDDQKVKLKN